MAMNFYGDLLERISGLFSSQSSRWLLLLPLLLIGAVVAWVAFGWGGWVQSWVGAIFKAASGALLGYYISSRLTKLDLSAIVVNRFDFPEQRDEYRTTLVRGVAGIAQAILIVGLAIAVSAGF
jgi:hypothetical protein